jgi:WhiB family redox-sensing transcriptional regulator
MDRAACVETDAGVFFPEKGGQPTRARLVCASCPVTGECLAWGFRVDVLNAGLRYGVYGGRTPNQRHADTRETVS